MYVYVCGYILWRLFITRGVIWLEMDLLSLNASIKSQSPRNQLQNGKEKLVLGFRIICLQMSE